MIILVAGVMLTYLGWEKLDMVVRYTRSVHFEKSLKVMREMIDVK